MDCLTVIRIMVIAIELAIVGYATPAVFDLLRGRGRHGDPARLVVMGDALLMIGFVARWLIIPESDLAFVFLYTMSAVWACFTLFAMRAYGRDGRA